MGIAFDQACRSFRNFANLDRVRELVAKRIIEAAKRGERDPIRLQWQAVMGRSFDDVPMPADNVGRKLPSRVTRRSARSGNGRGPGCEDVDGVAREALSGFRSRRAQSGKLRSPVRPRLKRARHAVA